MSLTNTINHVSMFATYCCVSVLFWLSTKCHIFYIKVTLRRAISSAMLVNQVLIGD